MSAGPTVGPDTLRLGHGIGRDSIRAIAEIDRAIAAAGGVPGWIQRQAVAVDRCRAAEKAADSDPHDAGLELAKREARGLVMDVGRAAAAEALFMLRYAEQEAPGTINATFGTAIRAVLLPVTDMLRDELVELAAAVAKLEARLGGGH